MKFLRFSILLSAILVFFWPVQAKAQLRFGQPIEVRAAFCQDKEEAIAIATADAQEGLGKAQQKFVTSNCAVGVASIKLIKVVFSIMDLKDNNRVIRVVEVQVYRVGANPVTAYILTDQDLPDALLT